MIGLSFGLRNTRYMKIEFTIEHGNTLVKAGDKQRLIKTSFLKKMTVNDLILYVQQKT